MVILIASIGYMISTRYGGFWKNAGLKGSWVWNDASLFEFQKINFRFTPDSFYVVQRFIDPKNPHLLMPCALSDHQMYAAGHYFVIKDTLRFKGDFTDSRFSRDTLRMCRDTGFKGASQFTLRQDSLCLRAGPTAKNICLVRVKSGR